MAHVHGVGKDQETIVNDQGGKQSNSPYRADLLPPLALLSVAQVLKQGATKYGDNNWKQIPIGDHLNHLLVHVLAYLAGDCQDSHLSNACCRALFALQLLEQAKADLAAIEEQERLYGGCY